MCSYGVASVSLRIELEPGRLVRRDAKRSWAPNKRELKEGRVFCVELHASGRAVRASNELLSLIQELHELFCRFSDERKSFIIKQVAR